jgi:hypothetical protein
MFESGRALKNPDGHFVDLQNAYGFGNHAKGKEIQSKICQ